jgi:hypothetical protein
MGKRLVLAALLALCAIAGCAADYFEGATFAAALGADQLFQAEGAAGMGLGRDLILAVDLQIALKPGPPALLGGSLRFGIGGGFARAADVDARLGSWCALLSAGYGLPLLGSRDRPSLTLVPTISAGPAAFELHIEGKDLSNGTALVLWPRLGLETRILAGLQLGMEAGYCALIAEGLRAGFGSAGIRLWYWL